MLTDKNEKVLVDVIRRRTVQYLSEDDPGSVQRDDISVADPAPPPVMSVTREVSRAGLVSFELKPEGLHGKNLLEHMLEFTKRR